LDNNAPGSLLVVDDNKVNRLLLGRSFEQQGHRVEMAENGRVALEMMQARAYDLILLDIEMPEMNGYQVLEKVASNINFRDIPIIITSALDELESVVRCIEMGAEDYLTKPVNPVLLRARIRASLEKKRLRDQQRDLIRKFATSEVATDLETSGFALGGKFVEATAMFSDIRAFTTIAESQPPEDTIDLLNTYYTLMFEAISDQGGVVNQMVGDGLMAIFGAPLAQPGHCDQAVKAALDMIDMIDLLNIDRLAANKIELHIGIGIASGPVIAGYTGTMQRATYTCVGDTVNLAARLEAHTKVLGKPILIDETTYAALITPIKTNPEGSFQLKGKVNEVQVYSVHPGQKV
jgi:adenylate cyclase